MRRTGTRVIGFNVAEPESPDARKAYRGVRRRDRGCSRSWCSSTRPTRRGRGQSYWVKDRAGVEVPVVTARYSIWADANNRPRAGTPAKVAREIRDTLAATAAGRAAPVRLGDRPRVVVLPTGARARTRRRRTRRRRDAARRRASRGYTPVTWCAERLPADVRPMDPEEMAWRLRMRRTATPGGD